jgi:ADP-ribosylglycohydrolase/fructose-1,6-bisphosphatase/inositol monophosphatase family enzyme
MTSRYQAELDVAISAAQEAGAFLLEELHHPAGPRGAGGSAPADLEAERRLREILGRAFPQYGQRGEEDPSQDKLPSDPEEHVWLIDPNDGTSAFQEGHRGASVSLALIRRDAPVVGVVFSYAAPDDRGDLFVYAEGMPAILRNGVPVTRTSQTLPNETAQAIAPDALPGVVLPPLPTVLGSNDVVLVSHYADTRPEANAHCAAPARYRPIPGIAYRLALLAVGEGEAAVGLSRPRDFDMAAGHALLRAAGAVLLDETGQEITYSPTTMRRVRFCFAGSAPVAEALRQRPWQRAIDDANRTQEPLDLAQPKAGRLVRGDVLSRAQGCWLGQLAGDSLGSLVEFQSAAQIARVYPEGPQLLANGGTFDTLAGQPTDDSEMALGLARALLLRGRFDEEEVLRAYVAWYESHPFDIGNTTVRALSIAQQAKQAGQLLAPATRAGAYAASQANGALMRLSPLGIFGWRLSPEQLAAYAQADASLTHPHPFCVGASAVFAATLAFLIRTGEAPRVAYDFACDLAARLSLDPKVLETLQHAATQAPTFQPNEGWVKIALQNAFYQLLHAPNLALGVAWTVRQGGDTDTNAAICGALLGAAHGRSAIPSQWRKQVLSCRPLAGLPGVRHPRPFWLWPVDAEIVAEQLLSAGLRHAV